MKVFTEEWVYGFRVRVGDTDYGGARRFPADKEGSAQVAVFLHQVQLLADRMAQPAYWVQMEGNDLLRDHDELLWIKLCPRPGFWDPKVEQTFVATNSTDSAEARRAKLWLMRFLDGSLA